MNKISDNCQMSKRALQKEARRQEIIEAGLLEFTAQGFTSTRLEDVAERAGIGKGTIYLYFDSKESLFEAVVRKNLFTERDKAVNLAEEFTGSATELLRVHLNNMYQFMGTENIPQLLAIVIGEIGRFPKLADFFFNELVQKSQGVLSGIIKKGVESGEFQVSGLENYTQIIVSPIMLGVIWKNQFNVHAPIDMSNYAKTHIDFILKGLQSQN